MDQVFPYANIVAGVLVLVVGFGFHWIGQLVSVLNWDTAQRSASRKWRCCPSTRSTKTPSPRPTSRWAGSMALPLPASCLARTGATSLPGIPGVVLVYHAFSYWFWTGNRRKAGHKLVSDSMRIGWPVANFVTGTLAIVVAWNAC